MKKKYLKLIKMIILLIFLFVIALNCNSAYAKDGGELLKEMEDKTDNFIEKGSETNINYKNIANEFSGLGQILTMIGAGVMVGVTTYMGIKYLTAGPEAQAKLKVQLVGVVVSGLVIFGAYNIWKIVVTIASGF